MDNLIRTRALIVDDVPEVRLLAKKALENEGFLCDVAPDGQRALNMAESTSYGVVLTDLRMPVMHGHALITALSEGKRPAILAVLTAVAEPKLVKSLYEFNVDEVFIKPFDYPLLALKIRILFDKKCLEPATAREPAAVRASQQIQSIRKELKEQLRSIELDFKETVDELEEQQRKLEENYLGSVRVLANLFEQAGQFEGSHASRVEATVVVLTKALGVEGLVRRNIQLASLLHELGMFGMPDTIKIKPPWKLSREERVAYECYPSVGAAILSQVPGSSEIVEIVANHAENHDGSGFPEGKRGAVTPYGASILRLADGLDTFQMYLSKTADRETASIEHLEQGSGKSYDPKIVEAALSSLNFKVKGEEGERVRMVSLYDLEPGMILAQDVHGNGGNLLLRTGSTISEMMLPHLKNFVQAAQLRVYE